MGKHQSLTVNAIQNSLNKEGLGMILMARTPSKTTLCDLFKSKHLLLPREVVGPACALASDMRRTEMGWMGGGTSLGNELWDAFITPGVRDAKFFMSKKDFRGAFATLLGLLLYTKQDDDWLRDQEIYCNWR